MPVLLLIINLTHYLLRPTLYKKEREGPKAFLEPLGLGLACSYFLPFHLSPASLLRLGSKPLSLGVRMFCFIIYLFLLFEVPDFYIRVINSYM